MIALGVYCEPCRQADYNKSRECGENGCTEPKVQRKSARYCEAHDMRTADGYGGSPWTPKFRSATNRP